MLIFFVGVGAVEARRERDASALEGSPLLVGDVDEVRVDLDLHPASEGVLDDRTQIRVQCGLTADNADAVDARGRELADRPQPVRELHRPVGALRPAVGVAVPAFQLAHASDLQPGEGVLRRDYVFRDFRDSISR